jgi:hypothetical protein
MVVITDTSLQIFAPAFVDTSMLPLHVVREAFLSLRRLPESFVQKFTSVHRHRVRSRTTRGAGLIMVTSNDDDDEMHAGDTSKTERFSSPPPRTTDPKVSPEQIAPIISASIILPIERSASIVLHSKNTRQIRENQPVNWCARHRWVSSFFEIESVLAAEDKSLPFLQGQKYQQTTTPDRLFAAVDTPWIRLCAMAAAWSRKVILRTVFQTITVRNPARRNEVQTGLPVQSQRRTLPWTLVMSRVGLPRIPQRPLRQVEALVASLDTVRPATVE